MMQYLYMSWQGNSPSQSRNSQLLWNLKVHYCVHRTSPLALVLSQLKPVHTFRPYFFKIHLIVSSYLYIGHPSSLFPWGFLIKTLYSFFISPSHWCFNHLNTDSPKECELFVRCISFVLDIVSLITTVFGETYKVWILLLHPS
jgi:hypothetical protein